MSLVRYRLHLDAWRRTTRRRRSRLCCLVTPPSACCRSGVLLSFALSQPTVFGCFRFMELAEIGRCRAPISPPQTHRGDLLGSISMGVAVYLLGMARASLLHVPILRLSSVAFDCLCGFCWVSCSLRRTCRPLFHRRIHGRITHINQLLLPEDGHILQAEKARNRRQSTQHRATERAYRSLRLSFLESPPNSAAIIKTTRKTGAPRGARRNASWDAIAQQADLHTLVAPYRGELLGVWWWRLREKLNTGENGHL